MKNKIIAYLRVSTNKQTIDNQRHEINDYAVIHKLIIDEFIEIEITSKKDNKERRIEELKSKLNKGDTLIVSELSRLGRSTSEVLSIIDDFIKNGITIIFIKQGLTVSSDTQDLTSKVMITLFSLFAELERDLISKRTIESLKEKKSKGMKLGHKKHFLKSRYDDYENEIYDLKENMKLSFPKICNMLDKDESKNFKQRSMREWWGNRYELEPIFNIWQRNSIYKKHLLSLSK